MNKVANHDITIISLPDANADMLQRFKEQFKKAVDMPGRNPIVTNADIKIYQIRKGETYEIKSTEVKIKK